MSKKLYDYDEIMEYLNAGKAMDQSIQKLAKDIQALTTKTQECEGAFHGKGNGSISQAYKSLYSAIGSTNMEDGSGSGMWKNVSFSATLCNMCYTNAVKQKANDEGEGNI